MRTGRATVPILRAILAAALAAVALDAQVSITPRHKAPPKKEESQPSSANLRVDTNLVLIPVSVSDPLNRPVTGLERENFRLYEDKQERKITTFSMEDEPVAVGLVFDTSGSMGDKLRESRLAAHTFLRTSNPEDEFFLVEFDSSPRLAVPLTSNAGAIENQLVFTQSKGSTALLDGLMLALHEMRKSRKNKKALLLITDGGDNNSRYTETEIKGVLAETDCLVYAVGVFESNLAGRSREEVEGADLLAKIAESTGGRLYPASPSELPDITQKIGVDLRNRYVLGYSPASQVRDGRYHRVQVVVVPPRGLPPLRAHWRVGYYAPLE
ncbi:MAG TPA: VWA domain-containing protein [Bryobacteraceae bacterium]|nr:VWA domain-containing protein [Bryobacteraceae bacterium]